jgi:hypothetical protein
MLIIFYFYAIMYRINNFMKPEKDFETNISVIDDIPYREGALLLIDTGGTRVGEEAYRTGIFRVSAVRDLQQLGIDSPIYVLEPADDSSKKSFTVQTGDSLSLMVQSADYKDFQVGESHYLVKTRLLSDAEREELERTLRKSVGVVLDSDAKVGHAATRARSTVSLKTNSATKKL